jgi:hypothetical protein
LLLFVLLFVIPEGNLLLHLLLFVLLFVIPEGNLLLHLLLFFAVAVVSEIGPGFSPDIRGTSKDGGFSPRDSP